MTIRLVSPRHPLVDPRTGLVDTIWYRFFQDFFSSTTGIPETDGAIIAPSADATGTAQTLIDLAAAQQAAAQAPSTQPLLLPADDVLPVISQLLDQIEGLRRELSNLQQGTVL